MSWVSSITYGKGKRFSVDRSTSRDRADAVLPELAAIADDDEALRAARAGGRMALAIDAGEIEFARLHAKILACRASTSTRPCARARACCCPRTARTTRCTCCACAPAMRLRSSTGAGASSPRALL